MPRSAGKMLAMRAGAGGAANKLVDAVPRALADDIFSCALKRQTGVTLRHMLDFGSNPVERQLVLSAQFLRAELPIRRACRDALPRIPARRAAACSGLGIRGA